MSLEELNRAIQDDKFPIPFTGHWICGEWVQDKRSPVVGGSYNPSRDQLLTEISISKSIIDQAVEAGTKAAPKLSVLPLEKRLGIIEQFRHLIADFEQLITLVLAKEAGKPAWEAKHDFDAAVGVLDEIIQDGPDTISKICQQYLLGGKPQEVNLIPVGVTAILQNFSTPLNTVVQSFAAGILAGCPLIILTSCHAALMGRILGYIIAKVEGPTGSANVLFGDFKNFVKLLQNREVKAVVYSGSREHCDSIRSDSSDFLDRQLLLQSGGKNSLIVDTSADIDEALKAVFFGTIKSAGQLNTSTSRVFIPTSIRSEFTEKLTQIVRSLSIGPTDTKDAHVMGPLYSRKSVEKFLRFQTMAKRESAETISWGKALDLGTGGHFVTPGVHIFDEFDDTSSFQSNVFMCPDVAIYPYETMDQAVTWANTTNAPLVCSLYGDEKIIREFLPQIEAPNVMLNEPTIGVRVQPTLTGKQLCGGHRVSGVGILSLLTYPQACHSSEEAKNIINSWPWA
ncbi:MAG: aldehyde dehydrogenase family protein [Pseudobacteriovorax sp.]|nr:aldehyde dehydrogenase family protein [Pseudobacteriovorax sp.]